MTAFEHHLLEAPSLGAGRAEVLVHGHWGRPVLWFPSERGTAWEFSDHGMVQALHQQLDGGQLKVFCVPSYDHESWAARHKPMVDRARAQLAFEDWIVWHVLPFVRDSCAGRDDVVVAGPSLGAFQAVLLALRHAHLFGHGVALSGGFDPWRWHGWGEGDELVRSMNPTAFLPDVGDGHLDHLRDAVRLTLVVGSGRWEDSTGAREQTLQLSSLLTDKGIAHRTHVWGLEWPHDWPSWRAQAPHYLTEA